MSDSDTPATPVDRVGIPFRPKWYGCHAKDEPMGVVQVDTAFDNHVRRQNGNPKLPEHILRLAHAEYQRQHNQTFERMQERGGFSWWEVVTLLADHVDRLGGVPTPPIDNQVERK